MSIEKQELYNEINTLPEELMAQVIDFIEYLKKRLKRKFTKRIRRYK